MDSGACHTGNTTPVTQTIKIVYNIFLLLEKCRENNVHLPEEVNLTTIKSIIETIQQLF